MEGGRRKGEGGRGKGRPRRGGKEGQRREEDRKGKKKKVPRKGDGFHIGKGAGGRESPDSFPCGWSNKYDYGVFPFDKTIRC